MDLAPKTPSSEQTLTDDLREDQSQGGWAQDGEAGHGNAARCDELAWFDGEGAEQASAEDTSSVVAWVDSIVPVGVGVHVAIDGALQLGLECGGATEVTVVNRGQGQVDVVASIEGAVGGSFGEGVIGGGAEGTGEVGMEGGIGTTRTFRVPYTQILGVVPFLQVMGSCFAGEPVDAVATAFGKALGVGVDLNPFTLEEEYTVGMAASGEAAVDMLGAELGAVIGVKPGLTFRISYDDVVDAAGFRSGTVAIGGGVELLNELELDLGGIVDVEGAFPVAELASGVELDFDENMGTRTFTGFRVVAEAGGGVGDTTGGVGGSVGTDGVSVTLSAPLGPADSLWQGLSAALQAITGHEGPLDVESSVHVEFTLDLGAIAGASMALVGDIGRYLLTGAPSEGVAPIAGDIDAALAAIAVKMPVSASVSTGVEGEAKLGAGLVTGAEGSASAGLVYENEDASGLLPAPPVVEDVLARLRAAGGAATA